MSTSPDPPARPPRAALPAGEWPAEADNLPALRSPGQTQQRPASPPGSSSWFSPAPQGQGGPGPGPGAYGSPGAHGSGAHVSGPQGYGQSAWQQGSGYSPQGYGDSGARHAPGYGQSGYGQGSYGGYDQGGYGSPGPGAQGYGASGPGYGAAEPGYGGSGPGYGGSGAGYPAPGGEDPSQVPGAPTPPTRAEQRPEFTSPAGQDPFGPVPTGQQPAGGPRHAAPPPPADEPQLYDAAAHKEALYRRMRSNGSNSGSHRQPAPAFTAAAGVPAAPAAGTFGDPAYGGPARDDTAQSTQTFGAGQYGSDPSFDGPGFGGPGFGGPPPADAASWKPAKPQQRNRKKVVAGIASVVGVIVVGAGLGKFVVAPLMNSGPSSDPGCKAYQATALPAYDRTVGDLNAKARQPTLTSDLNATIGDLTSAQASAKSSQVKTALGGLQSELTSVRADVQKGYIPSSAVTALNNASHTADAAC